MYIDAQFERKQNVIKVVERINGKRIYQDLKPLYEFYIEDPNGTVPSITGLMTRRESFNTQKEMNTQVEIYKSMRLKTFESDCNVLFKTLYKHYKGAGTPKPHVAFFDIETDFHKEYGYAPPHDTFNAVIGISLYLNWKSELWNFVLKPKGLPQNDAESIVESFKDHEGTVVLCKDERDLFNRFFDAIEDADVLSGWNSSTFDIPYLVNRCSRLFSEAETTRFCLWGKQPKPKMVDNFGNDVPSYDLIGRIHMDYLDLYKKHTYQELQSYKLDYIGELEVGQNKVDYDGTLDQLYNDDFYKYIEYGLQDAKLLKLIDDVKGFINLHTQLAHDECVLISTTMGTVSLVDTAINNEAHSRGEVVFDKIRRPEVPYGAAGAWVADPKVGLHDGIGCIDFASLYPTVLRSLMMSTESMIGQVRHTYTSAYLDEQVEKQRAAYNGSNFEPSWTEAWHGLFACLEHTMILNKTDDILYVDLEDGSSVEMTAKELYEFIFEENSNIVISANGTLFDRSKNGVIPSVLTRWYTERKMFKQAGFDYRDLADEGIELPEDLVQELKNLGL